MRNITLSISLFSVLQFSAQAPIIPETDNNYRRFGNEVDISGSDIVVVTGNAEFSNHIAKIYFYEASASGIEEVGSFTPNDIVVTDEFGSTVSIYGDFAAVGASYHDDAGTDAGAVYIYRKVDGNWEFFQKITAFDAQPGDNFGTVKLANGYLYIGAPKEESSTNADDNTGAVYVYEFDGQWTFSQKLTVPASSGLGIQIEVENDRLVIAGQDAEWSATLYTFRLEDDWQFESDLPIMMTEMEFEFSADFCISQNVLYVIRKDIGVTAYNASSSGWNEDVNFVDPLVQTDQWYARIAVDGDRMFIGSTGYTLQMSRKWPVHYYQRIGDTWSQLATYHSGGMTDMDDMFGMTLSLGSDWIIIGAPNEFYGGPFSGKAYYMALPELGIDDLSLQMPQLYPNPAKSEVSILNFEVGSYSKAKIFNAVGEFIAEHGLAGNTISIDDLPSGVYFIKLLNSQGLVGGKMYCVAGLDQTPTTATFKVEDSEFDEMCGRPGFSPAPYLARYKWVAVDDLNRLTLAECTQLVEKSYDLVKSKLPGKIRKELGF